MVNFGAVTLHLLPCWYLISDRSTVQPLNTMGPITNLEMDYRVLSTLEDNPLISQRQLARQLDVSLGKVNYCLKALVAAGMVKAGNFKKNTKKSSYSYLLTPKGIRQKTQTTRAFLNRKMMEYDKLETEIAQLQNYLGRNTDV